jgi:glucose/arabinose dehydrogenase
MNLLLTTAAGLLALTLTALQACQDSGGPGDGDDGGPNPVTLEVEVVASGLTDPLYLTAPAGDSRLFVVEQPGRVRVVREGEVLDPPFLDITDRVSSGGERGLLSIAFHPDYSTNGYFYVSYTDVGGDTRIERYTVSADPDVAERASARLMLAAEQPFSNHNGGLIAFGPDGKLYIGLGDGGGAGDPLENAQDTSTLLGSLLRIDVDAGDPYGVPADNPFVGTPGADEIWAYGLRNPWRFAFDAAAGLLYIADVGQQAWEEIDVRPADAAGLNYGWDVMEGGHCFEPSSGCDQSGLVLPALEYARAGGPCAVTGGYVYRGDAIAEIRGHYFYSDFCAGFLRSFRFDGGAVADERVWDVGEVGSVLSFGVDDTGELYILSGNGNVYRLVAAA